MSQGSYLLPGSLKPWLLVRWIPSWRHMQEAARRPWSQHLILRTSQNISELSTLWWFMMLHESHDALNHHESRQLDLHMCDFRQVVTLGSLTGKMLYTCGQVTKASCPQVVCQHKVIRLDQGRVTDVTDNKPSKHIKTFNSKKDLLIFHFHKLLPCTICTASWASRTEL